MTQHVMGPLDEHVEGPKTWRDAVCPGKKVWGAGRVLHLAASYVDGAWVCPACERTTRTKLWSDGPEGEAR